MAKMTMAVTKAVRKVTILIPWDFWPCPVAFEIVAEGADEVVVADMMGDLITEVYRDIGS